MRRGGRKRNYATSPAAEPHAAAPRGKWATPAGGKGDPVPSPGRGTPAAHSQENNFYPAASASTAPVSEASIALPDDQRGILEDCALQIYMRIVFPLASRSAGRKEKGIKAAACVQPQAPPSLPGVELLLSSWMEGCSTTCLLLFSGTLNW